MAPEGVGENSGRDHRDYACGRVCADADGDQRESC